MFKVDNNGRRVMLPEIKEEIKQRASLIQTAAELTRKILAHLPNAAPITSEDLL